MTEKEVKMVEDNLSIVDIFIANATAKYPCLRKYQTQEDCRQTCIEVLCRAATTYEESKGSSFKTYCSNRLKWAIWDFVRQELSKGMKSVRKDDLRNINFSQDFNNDIIPDDDNLKIVNMVTDIHNTLNEEEMAIFSLLLDGLTIKKVARKLEIPVRTAYYLYESVKGKVVKTIA